MRVRYYWNLIRGKIRVRKPATLTLGNIRAVIQAFFRKRRELGGFKLEDHIYEQIIWRRTEVMRESPECWSGGHCLCCGCEILGKTMEDRSCSLSELDPPESPCYPAMMTKEVWKKYKIDNDIKLFE
jgi:hypothetical protein